MKFVTLVSTVLASSLGGAVLVVACSDDSPGRADAAVCDCPAAEPPVPARIQWITRQVSVNGMATNAVVAPCPSGAKALGGGCSGSGLDAFTILEAEPVASGADQGFSCAWRSTQAAAETATATAICLVP